MLDAPVSGMVGGDDQAYARVEPILRELGTATHVSSNGHGLALTLAINISLAVQKLALAEVLVLAPLVLELPDEAWFDIQLMQKDLVLALDTGRTLDAPLPTAGSADEVLTMPGHSVTGDVTSPPWPKSSTGCPVAGSLKRRIYSMPA